MNDQNGNNEGDFDPVCEPTIIRCEATFHPAPGFEYLDSVPCGESEAVTLDPPSHDDAEFTPNGAAYRLEDLFARPRMMCPGIENLRDLLLFASGICCGQRPLFGSSYLGTFPDYVAQRFQPSSDMDWTSILLREFGGRPFLDACGEIVELFRDWKTKKGD
jgi:hypothetical protein